jgi:hypothetical protein
VALDRRGVHRDVPASAGLAARGAKRDPVPDAARLGVSRRGHRRVDPSPVDGAAAAQSPVVDRTLLPSRALPGGAGEGAPQPRQVGGGGRGHAGRHPGARERAEDAGLSQQGGAAERDAIAALSRACHRRRGQLFLEVGYGVGEVTKAVNAGDQFGALWVNGALATAPAVRRRLNGWILSRVVRGLIVILPSHSDAAAGAQLVALCQAALRVSAPLVVVAPVGGCPELEPLVKALQASDRARCGLLTPCACGVRAYPQPALDAGGADTRFGPRPALEAGGRQGSLGYSRGSPLHAAYEVIGFHVGAPPTFGVCRHPGSVPRRPATPYCRLGPLAVTLSTWLRMGCERRVVHGLQRYFMG